jgi:hypothetical protein
MNRQSNFNEERFSKSDLNKIRADSARTIKKIRKQISRSTGKDTANSQIMSGIQRPPEKLKN